MTPHLHVLLPEGLWSEEGDWVVLPPPDDEEVEAVLHRLLRQVRALLAEVEESWPEEDLDVLRAEGAQHRLGFAAEGPKKKARRLAVALGFSLHADTAVHAFDRVGLRKLCGYGARGPVSEERLTRLPDGMKLNLHQSPVRLFRAYFVVGIARDLREGLSYLRRE